MRLLPAPAGMVPDPGPARRPAVPAPRTRGDGPSPSCGGSRASGCSPHPRGWSLRDRQPRRLRRLLPAPAGMVPPTGTGASRGTPAPRTRGDGPERLAAAVGQPLCSPHPRGWSLHQPGRFRRHRLLPAPAGMVPRTAARRPSTRSAPRTRGDGPSSAASATPATNCSPHPRGWPRSVEARPPAAICSPHLRGWSQAGEPLP